MVNDLDAAFRALLPSPKSLPRTAEFLAETAMIDRTIAPAVHNIFFGLSRATSCPPDFTKENGASFRLASRPVPDGKGRPRAFEAEFVALVCRIEYERITGKAATVSTDPKTGRPYGAYYDLVRAVLTALGIPDSAETAARAVRDPATVRRRRPRA